MDTDACGYHGFFGGWRDDVDCNNRCGADELCTVSETVEGGKMRREECDTSQEDSDSSQNPTPVACARD